MENDVPITFSFADKHISAFICNSSYNQDFLNGIMLQLMTYHSSLELKLVFLLTEKETEEPRKVDTEATENVESAAYITGDVVYHKTKSYVQKKIKQQ